MQMFDIVLVEMTCHRRIRHDVTHVEVRMSGLYTVRIAMIEDVACVTRIRLVPFTRL